ncbi:hypothetical protein CK226_33740 [Mesorhizobium sp. WSM4311]|nr:hypothetical protein CK226_33740 [Mesorhizobium sp. WSM4311]
MPTSRLVLNREHLSGTLMVMKGVRRGLAEGQGVTVETALDQSWLGHYARRCRRQRVETEAIFG